jgi:Uma2 family endonuclease
MYTIFNEDEEEYQLVEEPDPSYIYTYADYMQWKFKERLELFRGKIYKLSAPNTLHMEVSMKLSNKLYNFLQGKPCKVFAAPYDVRLPVTNRKKDEEITTVVQPDLGVVCDPSKIDARGICGAPDLVVEVLSPGNTRKELRIKHELYEEAGVKEYWIIYPSTQTVAVFLLETQGKFGSAKFYVNGDRLTAATVPGFEMEMDDIFPN